MMFGTDQYSQAQWSALAKKCDQLLNSSALPQLNTIKGHNDYANKSCPGFSVRKWQAAGMTPELTHILPTAEPSQPVSSSTPEPEETSMFDWKAVVRQVAPTLGTALGGPVAGAATKMISDRLLGKEDGSDAELAAALASASPQQLQALKEAENDFKVSMRELDIDLEKIHQADRHSARQLAANNNWPQIGLSGVFVLGYFSLVFALLYHAPELDDRTYGLVGTIIGVLTGAIPMILQFWFGSSKGSKDKDQLIKDAPWKK